MFKLLKSFAWLLLILLLCGGVDQLLVRVPLDVTGFSQAQTFYVDFRGRLLSLVGIDGRQQGPSIERLIEQQAAAPMKNANRPQRYLYVDDAGVLQFADGLEQVPLKYREAAQPLAE